MIATLTLLLLSTNALSAEVYFTPSKECESRIASAIDEAKKSVVVAVYSINNDRIVKSLINAKKRGVELRVLTDALQAAGRSSKVLDLVNQGINLRVHSKHKIMHNKFASIDDRLAVTGSYNWTRPASDDNAENCVFFSERNVIHDFSMQFENLWKLNSSEKSLNKIAKLKRKQAISRGLAHEEDTR